MPIINCFNKKVKLNKNKFYNLIEDDDIRVLAHTTDSIDALYFHIHKTIIKCTNKFYINGIPIYRRTHFPINDFIGFVEPKSNNLIINAGKYEFQVIKGYQLISNILNKSVNPKGVVGQTYKNIIDLPLSSYEIKVI